MKVYPFTPFKWWFVGVWFVCGKINAKLCIFFFTIFETTPAIFCWESQNPPQVYALVGVTEKSSHTSHSKVITSKKWWFVKSRVWLIGFFLILIKVWSCACCTAEDNHWPSACIFPLSVYGKWLRNCVGKKQERIAILITNHFKGIGLLSHETDAKGVSLLYLF